MLARKDQTSETTVALRGGFSKRNRTYRYRPTTEIRALLCDLKVRPHDQRQVLCRLLRRAAPYASSKDFAANPAVTHHTTAP